MKKDWKFIVQTMLIIAIVIILACILQCLNDISKNIRGIHSAVTIQPSYMLNISSDLDDISDTLSDLKKETKDTYELLDIILSSVRAIGFDTTDILTDTNKIENSTSKIESSTSEINSSTSEIEKTANRIENDTAAIKYSANKNDIDYTYYTKYIYEYLTGYGQSSFDSSFSQKSRLSSIESELKELNRKSSQGLFAY